MYIYNAKVDVAGRDVTETLGLQLRKTSGVNLHSTSAEREVVRAIKEKCCYIALNPVKEEKEALGRSGEEYELPDGTVIKVCVLIFNTHVVLFI